MRRTALRLLPLLLAMPLVACGEKPDALKASVQKAIDAGDGGALLSLAELKGTPAMAQFMLFDLPHDCGTEMLCTVSLAPLDADYEKKLAGLGAQGLEVGIKPEGVLKIEGKTKAEGKGKMSMTLPYAKVADHYRIVAQRYTAAKRAELEATTAQAAAEKTIAEGIPDEPGKFDRNLEWKKDATALPAGGGDPGAAYVRITNARAAAAKANDPDAAVAATGDWGKAVLGPTDYAGKPVPIETRKRKLAAQALRWEIEPQVLGGWIKGNVAVLVVEAKNGAGNVVRGAQLMEQGANGWDTGAADFVEIPAG